MIKKLTAIFGILAFTAGIAFTQPHKYIVNQNHPQSSDNGAGTMKNPFKTISKAAEIAQPGDEIIVYKGTYRETVVPARGGEKGNPITYRAAEGEEVYIKGSDVYKGKWEKTENQKIFRAKLDMESLKEFNPFAEKLELVQNERYPDMDSLRVFRRGQVFVNHIMLDEVDKIEDMKKMPGSWLAENQGRSLLIHFPHNVASVTDCLVEITTRTAVFRPEKRGLGYINVYNFILEHAANQGIVGFWREKCAPQQGLISTRSGHHWNICGNTIRYAKALGLDLGSERSKNSIIDGQPTPDYVGYHLIKDNMISDNGQGGIAGSRHIGTRIINNIFERNNNLGYASSEESAIKTHHYINGEITGNLIRDNYTNGIWVDNTFQNISITGNVILNNTGRGILLEMGIGPCLIANNIIGYNENGIYVHDAGGFIVAHNFLVGNKNFGVYARMVDERSCSIFPDSIQSFSEPAIKTVPILGANQKYVNNIFAENVQGSMHWIYPGPKAGNNTSDGNLFVVDPAMLQFELNDDGGTSAEQILKDYEKLENSLLRAKRPIQLFNNVLLNMKQWQAFMGNDKNSSFAQMKHHWQMLHPGPGPWLNFQLVLDSIKTHCQPVKGISTDFYGRKLDDVIVPGPFQQMNNNGNYHFRLWPRKQE